ncbi:TolC family outer membrane protein [Saccharospirillum impatiens]|uniref:TolC family outer membrane protein n=1 Tax=Saccharospirillum impatiens TaxID=169438 RepID=UPI000420FC3E|nr:TolC family outer membrane protein [Saccharospirillum impatiens]
MNRLIASITLAVASAGAWAEVSLMDVYRQALENDPELAIQSLNQRVSAVQVQSGFSELLPSVSASAGYDVRSTTGNGVAPDFDNGQGVSASITARQNIFALAAVDAYEALKLNASRVEIETESARQALIVRVAEAYISVLRAQEARDSAQTQLRAVERQFQQTEQRYEVGLVTVTDVLDAQATLDQSRVALISASSEYDISLLNLSVLTGETPDSVMSIGNRLPIQMPVENGQDRWVSYAQENHPNILAAEKGLESGERELQARRNNRLPVVSASASINYGDDPSDGLDFDDRLGSSIGLSVSVPLYTGGATSAQIVTTGLQNNIAEQRLVQLKRGISIEVGNYYRQLRTAAQNIDAQAKVVESRESALQATEVGYEVGTRNIVEVLNAQQAVFAARQDFANARYDYVISGLLLKQSAGQLTEDDLEQIELYLVNL